MGWSYQPPPDWPATVRRILRRDRHTCHVCGQPGADEVDHIINVKAGGTHDDDNLAAIHKTPCHERKTRHEAITGLRRWHTLRRRPAEPHPGLLPKGGG